jgi:Protein of unknown function (DUF3256).
MKKIYLLLLVCFLSSSLARSQNMENLFLSMPSEIIPTINQSKRLDLLDLYKSGKKSEIRDLLGGVNVLTALQDDFIRIETGTHSLELISLPMVNDSRLLLVIKTVCDPVCDSELSFYTVQWKKLEAELFLNPADKDWFVLEGADLNDPMVKNALLSLDISMMKFSYDPETKQLIQEYQTPEYLDLEQQKKVKKYLKQEPKIYRWNGIRFEE